MVILGKLDVFVVVYLIVRNWDEMLLFIVVFILKEIFFGNWVFVYGLLFSLWLVVLFVVIVVLYLVILGFFLFVKKSIIILGIKSLYSVMDLIVMRVLDVK